MAAPGRPDPLRFWEELKRRRVVRTLVYYCAGAWVLAQASELVLGAFGASEYLRFVVVALVLGLPVTAVLAWVFDITPSGIERTAPLPEPPPGSPPERSIAVLPFANLSSEPENEYFSDGLAEEIRSQLARVEGLRVAARTSSFAFKGRHEDVREIGRRLGVAWVLEGGVRKQADAVRIDLRLASAADGYQAWAHTFERRLDDIFRLQAEVAQAVTAAVAPRGAAPGRLASGTGSFDAFNLYLRGRHHFHKRTEAALRRAVDYFEQALARDPGYALAWSGLADAHTLASAGYYGNTSQAAAVERALPAARRALELGPGLAEAHASLGLVRHNQGDLEGAVEALRRALELNPNYTMAHVWLGVVLTSQGRHREAAERDREAFRLDPLSPIANTNVAFDALRAGDVVEAAARFAAAMEIDPAFPVPYSGMARLESQRGALAEARRWIEQAIERAPDRAFYRARLGLLLLQLGEPAEARASIEAALAASPGAGFGSDLVVALRQVTGDREALARIAAAPSADFQAAQRAQARLALGEREAARALYAQEPPGVRQAVDDLITDAWIWRLPHVVNHAHLLLAAGDGGGKALLEELLARLEQARLEGVTSVELIYLGASAHALLGRPERALQELEEAVRRGWRHAWWARHDWNLEGLASSPAFAALLARG